MRTLADFIAADDNIAPVFRRLFANPRSDVLTAAHTKQAPRRFTGEAITDFGGLGLSAERLREIRDEEAEYQHREEREERIQNGE